MISVNARSRIQSFHPGWFGAVMGTAIVGVAGFQNPGEVSWMAPAFRQIGQAFAAFAVVLGVVLAVPYITRWFLHPGVVLRELNDPVVGALYATFPGGILVLAATVAAVGPSLISASSVHALVVVLAWIGVPLAFGFSVWFAFLLFVGPEIAPGAVNGGWFIPPVVNIVVPMVLTSLVPQTSPTTSRMLIMACYAFWGMGFLLFILVLSMLYGRLSLRSLPPAGFAPSLWIGLGPVGVGALTLLKIPTVAANVLGPADKAIASLSLLAATALWGFGAWWFLVVLLLLVRYLRRGRLPFAVGWWAFTFPLGAFTTATLALAHGWKSGLLENIGAALFVLLVVFWVVVAARTLWAVRTGEVWQSAVKAPTNAEAAVLVGGTR